MIRIEVAGTVFDERSGSKNGKPWTIREQEAYAHVLDANGKPEKYPVKFKVGLERDQPPYQPGMYQPDPRSITVVEFGNLGFKRLRLMPLNPAKA